MRIVAISDTHTYHRKINIPFADILIHCGDISYRGELDVMEDFINWLGELPHATKIVIGGNHDLTLDPFRLSNMYREKYTPALLDMFKAKGINYLFEQELIIDGIKFFGTPFVPNLPQWSFCDKGENKFLKVPDDVNVLITHGGPRGIRDWRKEHDNSLTHFGSDFLRDRVKELKDLKINCFGHCHDAAGIEEIDGVKYINASICDERYNPINPPIVIDI